MEQALPHADYGSAYLAQHLDMKVESLKNGTARARNVAPTPLDRYYKRDQITKSQYDAGRRLHADFLYAGMAPKVTASYKALLTGGGKKRQRPQRKRSPPRRQATFPQNHLRYWPRFYPLF